MIQPLLKEVAISSITLFCSNNRFALMINLIDKCHHMLFLNLQLDQLDLKLFQPFINIRRRDKREG